MQKDQLNILLIIFKEFKFNLLVSRLFFGKFLKLYSPKTLIAEVSCCQLVNDTCKSFHHLFASLNHEHSWPISITSKKFSQVCFHAPKKLNLIFYLPFYWLVGQRFEQHFRLGSPKTSCLAGHVLAQNSFRFCELPFFFPILTLFFERRRAFQIIYMYDFSVLCNISQICPTKAKFWYALPSDQLMRDGYRTLCVRFREPSRVHCPSASSGTIILFLELDTFMRFAFYPIDEFSIYF